MKTLLHLDASARLSRSHSRRLSARFRDAWQARRPGDRILRRDLGLEAPPPVTEAWIAAAFTRPERRTPEMHRALAVSDALVDELETAEVIFAGVPMYNFGIPAPMKAWIDNIVRVGRTFGFDRSRRGVPYWPLLSGKRLVLLTARGDGGYDGPLSHMNHVEPHLRTVFGYIGITEVDTVAVEYDEFGDERLEGSLAEAESAVDALAASITEALTRPEGQAA